MRKWSNFLRLETRSLNVQGHISVSAVSGKGHDSGWSKVRAGLVALGFSLKADDGAEGSEPDAPIQIDERRRELLGALSQMPDEAFGWFVIWTQRGYPDGLGGFQAASRTSIEALKVAGADYMNTDEKAAIDAHGTEDAK